MDVRQADVTDIGAICSIDRAVLGSSRRHEFLARAVRDGRCWVACVNTAVRGFLVFHDTFFEHRFVDVLMVDPGFRRMGIASSLMRSIEATCPSDRLFTSTNQSNETMQCVCETLGYVKSGFIDNLDDGDPEIVYCKRFVSSTD